jgi:hypothetical protein
LHLGAAALLAALVVTACDSDNSTTTTDVVEPADAITAMVAWQSDERPPVLGDDGNAQLPVIYVVTDDGAVLDVGVQANVAAATVDWATVRFADDVTDTFDPDLTGQPVRDDGVMLLVGAMPEPAPTVELDLVRFYSAAGGEPIKLDIAVVDQPAGTDPHNTADEAPRAIVTAVTQP